MPGLPTIPAHATTCVSAPTTPVPSPAFFDKSNHAEGVCRTNNEATRANVLTAMREVFAKAGAGGDRIVMGKTTVIYRET